MADLTGLGEAAGSLLRFGRQTVVLQRALIKEFIFEKRAGDEDMRRKFKTIDSMSSASNPSLLHSGWPPL